MEHRTVEDTLALVQKELDCRPAAQKFIRRRFGIPNAPIEYLARYIVTYGEGCCWWASLGAPHRTSGESHGAGICEQAAIADLLDNLHRVVRCT